jgi:hypothetical protein
MALFSLALAIKAAAEQPQYAVVKERATLMHEALTKQFAEQLKKEETEQEKEEKEEIKST